MIYCHIDPGYLSAPSYPGDADEAIGHIERVVILGRDLREVVGVELSGPESVLEALAVVGGYPARKAIEDMLSLYGIGDAFSVGDLVRIYSKILEQMSPFSSTIGFSYLPSAKPTLSPNIYDGMLPSDLVPFSEAAAFEAACAGSFSPDNDQIIYVPCLTGPGEPELDVVGGVSSIIASHGSQDVCGPFTYFGKVRRRHDPKEWYLDIDEQLLWNSAAVPKELHLAISVLAIKISKSMGKSASYTDLPKFFVGSDFLESLIEHGGVRGGAYSNSILEGCARIVCGIPKYPVGDLLDGDGNVVIRALDKAPSRRTHVSKKGEALRLLFWNTEQGMEFANVGVKNELQIARGNLAARCG